MLGSVTDDPSTRFEQSVPALTYTGSWTTVSNAALSGGDFTRSSEGSATMTAHFTGTEVALIALRSPTYGIASVSIDGGDPVDVDLYAPSAQWKSAVWTSSDLADGQHTIVVSYTGRRNPAATGNTINVDALDVLGSLD